MQVVIDREEKLSNGSLPQLETRLQRVPADVCDADRKCARWQWKGICHVSGPVGLLLRVSISLTNCHMICFTLELTALVMGIYISQHFLGFKGVKSLTP